MLTQERERGTQETSPKPVARGDFVPAQEFYDGHPLLPLLLQIFEREGMIGGPDEERSSPGFHGAGRQCARGGARAEDLQDLPVVHRECSGRRRESADVIADPLGGPVPVDPAVFPEYLRGGARKGRILRTGDRLPLFDEPHRMEDYLRTHLRETVVERPGVVVGLNGGARLEKDVSRVDRLFKEKCGHAGLPFTVHDCAVDGSRSAVTGKE